MRSAASASSRSEPAKHEPLVDHGEEACARSGRGASARASCDAATSSTNQSSLCAAGAPRRRRAPRSASPCGLAGPRRRSRARLKRSRSSASSSSRKARSAHSVAAPLAHRGGGRRLAASGPRTVSLATRAAGVDFERDVAVLDAVVVAAAASGVSVDARARLRAATLAASALARSATRAANLRARDRLVDQAPLHGALALARPRPGWRRRRPGRAAPCACRRRG